MRKKLNFEIDFFNKPMQMEFVSFNVSICKGPKLIIFVAVERDTPML